MVMCTSSCPGGVLSGTGCGSGSGWSGLMIRTLPRCCCCFVGPACPRLGTAVTFGEPLSPSSDEDDEDHCGLRCSSSRCNMWSLKGMAGLGIAPLLRPTIGIAARCCCFGAVLSGDNGRSSVTMQLVYHRGCCSPCHHPTAASNGTRTGRASRIARPLPPRRRRSAEAARGRASGRQGGRRRRGAAQRMAAQLRVHAVRACWLGRLCWSPPY